MRYRHLMEPNPSSWTDFFKSERGVFALALLIAATVLVALGHFTSEQWKEFAQWIAAFYLGGKSLTGAAMLIANRPVTLTGAVMPIANRPVTPTVITNPPTTNTTTVVTPNV